MDHTTAVRTMAVEKYLLNELDPQEQESFEEHFFCCEECAREIRFGSSLMTQARAIFRQEDAPQTRPVAVAVKPSKREWMSWLRPAFAVPAMALMAGVLFFQNVVQLPAMHRDLVAFNSPAVLPSAYLARGSARGDDHVVTARPGEIFELTIDLPDSTSTAHVVELYDSAGQKKWSLPVAAEGPKESLTLKMPGDLAASSYSLVLKKAGAADAGEVSHYSFTLNRQS